MGRKWWGVALALYTGFAHGQSGDALCEEFNGFIDKHGVVIESGLKEQLKQQLVQGRSDFLEGFQLWCGLTATRNSERGLALLKSAALAGQAEALQLLIAGYAGGRAKFPLDGAEAMKWAEYAMKHGEPRAVVALSSDVNINRLISFAAVEKGQLRVASDGYSLAMAQLGLSYFFRKQYAYAAPWLQLAAAQDHSFVYGPLAWLYSQGAGVPRDETKAFYWGQKAMDVGAASAYFYMADVIRAFATEKDTVFRWHLRMAQAGVQEGMLSLGDSYDHGDGVAADEKEAERWWSKAASLGAKQARIRLDGLALRRKLRHRDEGVVLQLKEKAKDGTVGSLLTLARHLDQTRKFDDAVAAYRDAVRLGSVDAKFALGLKLADPDRTQSQQREGFELIVQAAAEKESQALQWLRTTYLFGGTVQRNLIAAYALDFLTSYVNDEGVATNLSQYKPTFDDALTAAEVANAQQLVRDMLKPGNFAAALSAVSAN